MCYLGINDDSMAVAAAVFSGVFVRR